MSGNQYGGYASQNPYQESYELNPYGQQSAAAQGDDDFIAYMDNISKINNELDNYNQLIELIQFNQNKILNEVNEEQEQATRKQLDSLISQASAMQQKLKATIKDAQANASGDSAKRAQAENTRQRFLKLIQDYRNVEADYRQANEEQAVRQYQIVQPTATEAEAREAVSDIGGQQIFSQAILNASRRGEAKTALAEVQSRHRELQKLEKTMAELAQLFHDMEELVAEQNVKIENVAQATTNAQKDIELGLGHTEKAKDKARAARRKKCCCYWILAIIIIIIIVVIVVPLVVKFA